MCLKATLLLTALITSTLFTQAQEDLLDVINDGQEETTTYTTATFKGTRIVNLQSSEITGAGVMQFIVLHRFGAFNDDFLYNFFGLDESLVRLSLDYSFNDYINVGVGRSSRSKVYDGWLKAKILRQSTGAIEMPISLLYYGSLNVNTTRFNDGLDRPFTERLSYVNQLIVARKFNDDLSLELAPTMVHYNLVQTEEQRNTLFGVGAGARYKLTNRVALTAEYMWQATRNSRLVAGAEVPYNDALSIGVDIETGGHVFQLHLTNARNITDPNWMMQTPGSWTDGEIYFGFNISRVFTIKKPELPDSPNF